MHIFRCVKVPAPPEGEGWIHEIKHEGYRTPSGPSPETGWTGLRDITSRGRPPAATVPVGAARRRGDRQDEQGRSDFESLKSAIEREPERLCSAPSTSLEWRISGRSRLAVHRHTLRKLIGDAAGGPGRICFSDDYAGEGAELFAEATEAVAGEA